jgi:hypothetical protein
MSLLAKIETPFAPSRRRGAGWGFVAIAAMLAMVGILIAAQIIFTAEHPAALDVSAEPTALNIVGP